MSRALKGHQKGSNFKEEDIALPLWELLLRAVKLEELLWAGANNSVRAGKRAYTVLYILSVNGKSNLNKTASWSIINYS